MKNKIIQTNEINIFILEAQKMLCSYFKQKISSKDLCLTDIYPLGDEISNYIDEPINNLNTKLGTLYESSLTKEARKDMGCFFTNDTSIIDSMINNCDLLSGKILEPSCGTGLFLVEIIKKITSQLQEKNYSSSEILSYILDNIYGNDIDAQVLKIAEINVLSTLIPLIIDAANKNTALKLPALKLFNRDYVQKEAINDQFSLIIGNPPYVTLYGKRSRNMTEEKRAYYNTFDFVQNKNGNNKFNVSMFFIENGLKQLQPEGNLYYILDLSFFETAYTDIRKYILENYQIISITKGLQAFDNVASGQILLKIRNTKCTNSIVEFKDHSLDKIKHVNQNEWINPKNKYKIIFPAEGFDKIINEKIKEYPRLDTYYPDKALRTCCALTGRTDDFIVNPLNPCSCNIYPYIEGSKGLLDKFSALTPQRYIKYDYDLQIQISNEFKRELTLAGVKNKKRVTLGDKEVYDAPKLFIRQSSFELIATYTEEKIAANNSIYALSNKDYSSEGKNLLKYVCGILNSNLMTYYCRFNNIIRAEKGKTPQIKISDLKDVRINLNEEYFESIVSIVNKLLNNPKEYNQHMDTLNQLVYKLYGINSEEIEYIEKYIASIRNKAA